MTRKKKAQNKTKPSAILFFWWGLLCLHLFPLMFSNGRRPRLKPFQATEIHDLGMKGEWKKGWVVTGWYWLQGFYTGVIYFWPRISRDLMGDWLQIYCNSLGLSSVGSTNSNVTVLWLKASCHHVLKEAGFDQVSTSLEMAPITVIGFKHLCLDQAANCVLQMIVGA